MGQEHRLKHSDPAELGQRESVQDLGHLAVPERAQDLAVKVQRENVQKTLGCHRCTGLSPLSDSNYARCPLPTSSAPSDLLYPLGPRVQFVVVVVVVGLCPLHSYCPSQCSPPYRKRLPKCGCVSTCPLHRIRVWAGCGFIGVVQLQRTGGCRGVWVLSV